MIERERVLENLKDLLRRFEVFGAHHAIVGNATRFDESSRSYGAGYGLAYREATEYLRDTLQSILTSDDGEDYDEDRS